MSRLVLLIALLAWPALASGQAGRQASRTLAGKVYFTNNTPPNRHLFPVELLTYDKWRRVAATKLDRHGGFELTGLRPGRYLLKFTWPPDRCTLLYRVDVRRESKTRLTVIMDAACGDGGAVQDLDDN
ncbi:MAG TPA: hypothetical protein VGV59_15810 [Pyrinomonadaceae bacterium]|nr:hypothetical protein [Pyrinomonadaceae bacterium]